MSEGPLGTDQERLAGYVDVWWEAVDDFTRLLEELEEGQWSAATALPGWTVHDVAAHTAHIEAVSAGAPEDPMEFEAPAHVTSLGSHYTESGVLARRDRGRDELINEIRENATARRTALLADPPTDGSAAPPRTPGGVAWSWETLLRNRPLDVWFHEQDVRRAVGLPMTTDTAAGQHTADYLTESLGYVVGKRAQAPAGTSVVLEVSGSPVRAVTVDDSGRGRPSEAPDAPTVRITVDREPFLLVAGGRDLARRADWQVDGDAELGTRIVEAFVVTP